MLGQIIQIAILCIVIGGASIPISFTINDNPAVVWVGNALGSLISALVVIHIGDRITSNKFRSKVQTHRVGKKIILVFDEGDDNKKVQKAQTFINKHGLRLFSLVCPIFPGVLISTAAVYVLDLNKAIYKRWMFMGVIFVSGAYVYGYWWTFVK